MGIFNRETAKQAEERIMREIDEQRGIVSGMTPSEKKTFAIGLLVAALIAAFVVWVF